MPEIEIKHLASLECRLGEGPIWHPGQDQLYCLDIEGKSVWRIDPQGGEPQHFQMGMMVGCLGIRRQGGFVLAGDQGFATWDPNKNETTLITNPEADRMNARFNDGSVDPAGRFWAGTMTSEGNENSLYRMDPDHSVKQMETGIGISNGIGWSPDHSTMYFTDSARNVIYAYSYDMIRGEIEQRRVWVNSREETGSPDGLCVDQEGCVWSACWDGWRISRYDPQGQLMVEVAIPVQRPTSCAFGGDGMNTLFITSAWTGLSESERQLQPLAGDLFAIECDTPGLPPNFFAG